MTFERANIKAMTGYTPGEQPGDQRWIKLNTNENPYGPSPAVVAALDQIDAEALRRCAAPTAEPFRRLAADPGAPADDDRIKARIGGIYARQKTRMGPAIRHATKRLNAADSAVKLMILLTDGVNNSGELTPDQAGQLARTEGVRVHIVGLASDQFARQSAFIRSQGSNPSSEIDDAAMTRVAEMTGGRYFRARTLEDLVEIYDELDQIEPIEQDEQTFRPVKALFHWPLGLALILSFLMALAATPLGARLTAFRGPASAALDGRLAGRSRS